MVTLHKIDKKALIEKHRIIIMGIVSEGEIPCDKTIFYNLEDIPSGVPKLVNGVIVPATEKDLFDWGMINIDDIRDRIRLERIEAFKTLLIYDVAVLRGDIQESKEEKMIRDNYKKAWLDFPERITEENVFLINVPKTPEFIEYFNQKGR